MNYEIQEALGQIAREKNVRPEQVLETLQAGLVLAAKKKYGLNANIEVTFEPKVGLRMVLKKAIVDAITDPQIEVTLADAQAVDPAAQVGGELIVQLPIEHFGRNAILATKQVVNQRVRELERDRVFNEYHDRMGEIVRGTVQQVDRGNVIVKLDDRSEGILPVREQISRDHYRQGDYVRAYVLTVEKSTKGPQVVLSRTHPDFLVKLFESEVPEIAEGVVQIRAVAREPGTRSKIAVHSGDERIDPVGACVGIKGSRVQAVVRELSGERIDIVPWSPDSAVFARRALAPAKVLDTEMDEANHKLIVHVADDQLSLAIGKAGQNARLAAKLTGWSIELVAKGDRARGGDGTQHVDLATIAEIGPKLAERLAREGIETADDVARVGLDGVKAVPGVGEKLAERIVQIAQEALAHAQQVAAAPLEPQESLEPQELQEPEPPEPQEPEPQEPQELQEPEPQELQEPEPQEPESPPDALQESEAGREDVAS